MLKHFIERYDGGTWTKLVETNDYRHALTLLDIYRTLKPTTDYRIVTV